MSDSESSQNSDESENSNDNNNENEITDINDSQVSRKTLKFIKQCKTFKECINNSRKWYSNDCEKVLVLYQMLEESIVEYKQNQVTKWRNDWRNKLYSQKKTEINTIRVFIGQQLDEKTLRSLNLNVQKISICMYFIVFLTCLLLVICVFHLFLIFEFFC